MKRDLFKFESFHLLKLVNFNDKIRRGDEISTWVNVYDHLKHNVKNRIFQLLKTSKQLLQSNKHVFNEYSKRKSSKHSYLQRRD